MNLRWVDVSIPMSEKMTVWPGDTPFSMYPASQIETGDQCNTSHLVLETHTGTHVDAPWHFEPEGRKLDAVDSSVFFGNALVIDLPDIEMIKAEHLPHSPLPERILFRTGNSLLPTDGPFHEDYTALSPDAAERLVADNVRLVGIDYLSIAPFQQEGQTTHHVLLRNNVFIVEGLRLQDISAGMCYFVVLPLPITGSDGAPCRAFIGVQNDGY